jgi:hypothetical protein
MDHHKKLGTNLLLDGLDGNGTLSLPKFKLMFDILMSHKSEIFFCYIGVTQM